MFLSCTLLDLSTELIIEILSYLPAMDLFFVQRTCRTIHDIIAGTARLQYVLLTHIHGVDDLLPPDFPYSERLELLQRHEQSRKTLQFNLLTQCVTSMPYPDRFTLRDGYLIYETLTASTPQYGYTDLCSVSCNEEVRWVHVTMDKSRLPLPLKVRFAPDHDLVVAIRSVSFPLPS
jgi:F-box domain